MLVQSWGDWQNAVVAVIRMDFHDVLDNVHVEDIDWDAWRPLYDEGRTPKAAVDRAFVRLFEES